MFSDYVTHFLSKHSWKTHSTLKEQKNIISNISAHWIYSKVHMATTLIFAVTLLVHSSYLVAFQSSFTTITSRSLMEHDTQYELL